jgi:tubulin-specific chaperone B
MLAQQRAEMIAQGIEVPVELHDDSYKEEADKIQVGNRCQCSPGERLGTVRYVGRIGALKAGWWIGVEFDEPVGKGDGSVKGAKVFECRPGYGGFLRPEHIEVGDFPEEEF